MLLKNNVSQNIDPDPIFQVQAFWDTSTGEFGNNGVHYMDRVRWAMKVIDPISLPENFLGRFRS